MKAIALKALRYLWSGFCTTCSVVFFAVGVVVLLLGTALVCAAVAAWPGDSPIRLPRDGEKTTPADITVKVPDVRGAVLRGLRDNKDGFRDQLADALRERMN